MYFATFSQIIFEIREVKMKKIIIFIFFMFLITGCSKEMDSNDNSISEFTKKTLMERYSINDNKVPKEGETIEDNSDNNIDDSQSIDSIPLQEVVSTDKDVGNDENVDIDTTNSETLSNQIDCIDIDECMSLSLPIQFELKDLIDSVFYLEVKDNNNQLLGYSIDWSFHDYDYENYDVCIEKGNYLKEKISNSDYKCSDAGVLSVELGGDTDK